MTCPTRSFAGAVLALTCLLLCGCVNFSGTSYVVANVRQLEGSTPPIADVASACAPRTAVATAIAGGSAQVVDRVFVTADPESAGALMTRGWNASTAGERDQTMALFDLALQRADADTPVTRIHWSYGWAMYNLQDHACALAHFEAARISEPDQVRWVPHTFAVTYWQLGEQDLARRWYDVAVRNDPACWVSAKSAGFCSRYWRPQERRALSELFAMWKRERVTAGGD